MYNMNVDTHSDFKSRRAWFGIQQRQRIASFHLRHTLYILQVLTNCIHAGTENTIKHACSKGAALWPFPVILEAAYDKFQQME